MALKKPQPFRDYEMFVRDVMQQLLVAEGRTIKVQHNVQLEGRDGQLHQIDVYWEHLLGTVLQRVAVDCKHYNKNVSKLHVQSMIGLLQDVPGLSGMLATQKGFQKGAKLLASKHGIALRVIRLPEDADYDGLVRRIELLGALIQHELRGAFFQIDKSWYDAQTPSADLEAAVAALKGQMRSDRVMIEDRETGKRQLLMEIGPTLPGEIRAQDQKHTLTWNNAYVSINGSFPMKLHSATITYDVVVSEWNSVIESELAKAVVTDPTKSLRLFVEKDGRITGPSARPIVLKKPE